MSRPTIRRRPTLLWHLLEEGSCNARQLAQLTGWSADDIYHALPRMVAAGLCVTSPNPGDQRDYALTERGIECAQQVRRENVTFAAQQQQQQPLPAEPPLPVEVAGVQMLALEAGPVEAIDPVFAVNSRGELAIDSRCGLQLRLGQPDALALKRFLDNVSVIEEATP